MRHLTCLLLSCLALSGAAQLTPEDQSAIEANCRKVAKLHSRLYMDAEFDVETLHAVQSPQLVTIDSLRQLGWNLEEFPRPDEPVVLYSYLDVQNDTARCYFRNPEGEPYYANIAYQNGWKVVGYLDQTYPESYIEDFKHSIDSLLLKHTLYAPFQDAVDAFGEAYKRFLENENPAELQGVLTPAAIEHLAASHAWSMYEDAEGAEPWPEMTVTEFRSGEGYIKCDVLTADNDRSSIILKPQRNGTYLVAGFKGRISHADRAADLRERLAHARTTEPIRTQLRVLQDATNAYLRDENDAPLSAVTTPAFKRAVEGMATRLGPYTPTYLRASGPSGAKWNADDIRINGDSALVSDWRHTLILVREKGTWKAANLLDQTGHPLGNQPQLTHFDALKGLFGLSYSVFNEEDDAEEEVVEIEAIEYEVELAEPDWAEEIVEMPPAQEEVPGPPRPAVELSQHPEPTQGWQAFIDVFTAAHPQTDQPFQAECIIEKDGTLGEIHIHNSGGGPHEPVTQLLQTLAPTWTPARRHNAEVRSTLHLILYPAP